MHVHPSGRAKGTLVNIGCRDPVPVTLSLPCSSWRISRESGLQVSLSTWVGSHSSSAVTASALPSSCGPERALCSQRAFAVCQPSLCGLSLLFVVQKLFNGHQLSFGRNCSKYGIHSFSVLFAGGSSPSCPASSHRLWPAMSPFGFAGGMSSRVSFTGSVCQHHF